MIRPRLVPLVIAAAAASAEVRAAVVVAAQESETTGATEAPLRVGARVEGEVDAAAEVAHSETLDAADPDAVMWGVRFALEVDTPGPVTIDLRSYLFDAYLIVEDASGRVIGEDDDGLVGTQSRIVTSLEPGSYAVVAYALPGGVGPFVLEVRFGASPPMNGPELRAAEIEDARRTVEAREEVLGRDAPAVAEALNVLGYRLESGQRYAEAEPLYLRALEIDESVLGVDHPSTATSLSNLAGLYQSQGRYGESEPLYFRALEIRESVLGAAHPDTATSLNDLAVLYESQGRYEEAEPLYVRALEIRESVLGADHPNTSRSLNNLAGLYESQGRYVEAEPLYVRALEIDESALGAAHPDTATSLSNLAGLYESQGRYAEAEPLYVRALEIDESALGAAHPDTATSLNNLAVLYLSQGRHAEAEPFFVRALEIHESVLGADHPKTATSLNNLAALHESQGRHGDAERLYVRALEIRESVLGAEHPKAATSLDNLAGLYLSQGRYAEAEPLYVRAVEIDESVLGPAHPMTATSLNNLAGLYASQGRYVDAEPLNVRALEIRESALGADHPQTATSLKNLAVSYESQGRYAEALPLMLRALDGGQSWVLRELTRSTGDRRFSIAGTQLNAVDQALLEWSAHPAPRPALDEVYRRVCAWKGVVFRHVTRLSRALDMGAQEDPELRRLRDELVELEGRLSLLAYAEQIADPAAHGTQLADLRARRREVQREVLSRLGIEPERETTDGAELSRLLPERTAVLDFLIHEPWSARVVEDGELVHERRWDDPRMLCFVTVSGAGEPVVVDLGDAARLETATDAWLDRFTGPKRGAPAAAAEEEPGETVRALLFDPIRAALPAETTRLFVIPDGFLGEVPFGAVPVGKGRYVLEAVDVVYATDPVTLRDRLESAPRRPDRAPSILAVGGVDYDARAAAGASLAAGVGRRGGSRGFSRDWGPLPGTAEEVAGLFRQATRAHPEAEPPRILEGVTATEEAVKTLVPGRTILHLATHGFFEREGLVSRWTAALARAHQSDESRGLAVLSEPANPWRGRDPFATERPLEGEEPGLLAGLVLAGANVDSSVDPDRDDGVLTATEVAALDLSSCRLAVLSACQSALGSGRSGEGLQSLRRAFAEAGAASVIASLWKVDDAATRRLMRAFYEELWTNGRGVGDALRRARLKLLRNREDPAHWGAFTLSGEWR